GVKTRLGKEAGVTERRAATREHIAEFADAPFDAQWIRVDRERAARGSPYKPTVARGFLTLSLLPHFFKEAVEIEGARMGINYGLNRVRFTGPVPAGSRVRARFRLASAERLEQGVQLVWNVTVELEGAH